MAKRLDFNSETFLTEFNTLLAGKRENDGTVIAEAKAIVEKIQLDGDNALLGFTSKFDGLTVDAVSDLAIGHEELKEALTNVERNLRSALELAAERIRSFHEKQLPSNIDYIDDVGVKLGMRHTPLDAVGLYVPGGKAAYPSSVLMNAIPAFVAGVERRVMVVPASDGKVNPLVLAAAAIADVSEVWRIGGAQAVAALAYGTETIVGVDKIVGPGNAYVAAAKRHVFGDVGIDSIAGPSEILVVADAKNNPSWIAADLLSQAEHDEAAQAILITDDQDFARLVEKEIESTLANIDRANIAQKSWRLNGAIITIPSMEEMPSLANRIASEHLELALEDGFKWANKIHNAGAIFVGRYTPEAIGDYIAGPNHVLPTARTAKFSSGLGVSDFMKRTTTVSCSEKSFNAIAPAGIALAEAEGLGAHALSMQIRMFR